MTDLVNWINDLQSLKKKTQPATAATALLQNDTPGNLLKKRITSIQPNLMGRCDKINGARL